MSNINSHIIEQISHVPHGVENPTAMIALAAAGVVGGALATGVFHKTVEEKSSADYGGNGAMLDISMDPAPRHLRTKRLAGPVAFIAGAGLAAAGYFGHPTYNTYHDKVETNVVLVDDVSNSMLLTRDITQAGSSKLLTRSQAINNGIAAATFNGSLAGVQVGSTTTISLPLSKAWHTPASLSELETPAVATDGGQIIAALQTAAGMLPYDKADPTKRDGVLDILSDGTVDGTQTMPDGTTTDVKTAIATEANVLHKEGIKVQVVVPGTGTGNYDIPNGQQHVSSAADTDIYSPLGPVHSATSAEQVAAAVKETIHAPAVITDKHEWDVLADLGAIVAVGGVLRMTRKEITKRG